MDRFPYLKINRTILDLKDHIICKHSVQRSKIVISRFCSVCLLVSPVLLAVVYKAPPDNSSSIRLYGFCQHIGPICMVSSIGKRSGTAFGICFHQKSPQIGNILKQFSGFLFPPLSYLGVQRITERQAIYSHRRRKINRQIHGYPIVSQDFSQGF